MNFSSFKIELQKQNIFISDAQIESLKQYMTLLKEWNNVMDLTAICDDEGIIEKHFYDSLVSSNIVKYTDQSLLDVGTGAGFPGLVLKIIYPELKVTLLEPTLKRCKFLEAVIEKLNIKDCVVINKRAEDFINDNRREYFDLVTARAVSRLNILLELTIPFLKVNGLFIALKGKNARDELKDAENALNILNANLIDSFKLTLPSEQESREVLLFQKLSETNKKYPRIYGTIKKKPL